MHPGPFLLTPRTYYYILLVHWASLHHYHPPIQHPPLPARDTHPVDVSLINSVVADLLCCLQCILFVLEVPAAPQDPFLESQAAPLTAAQVFPARVNISPGLGSRASEMTCHLSSQSKHSFLNAYWSWGHLNDDSSLVGSLLTCACQVYEQVRVWVQGTHPDMFSNASGLGQ